MDKNIYYLVVEARPKEFMRIDIYILLKSNMNFSSIEIIDSFTKEYTYGELMNMIIQNNLLPNSFLNGKLYVINDKKFRFKVLTKDDNLILDDFFINNIEDKLMMNKFYNIFLKYVKDEDIINMMKSALITKNISQILDVLCKLNYLELRMIYVYIEKIVREKEEKRVLKNDN